ncbi:ATP-dependent helicase HrpB [Sphingomonas mesophila]|uniref:ATP-dependent helicase HrpB n=1 Tax=Sphingomonas mesophila TaxID=2303576 RepID=UPI000E5759A7|nr:ATP-dependent helicase HrpB [Sphingomonas mesophila]
MRAELPIDTVIDALRGALRGGTRALLAAPPGAGKTTRVAPALLGEQWCAGQILLLVPRRLAARSAAEHMAREAGQAPGATIGYQTRLDSRTSAATRIIVMTHGVFLARIQADPELAGVSALLFDEVHERGLDSDLGLALALDAAAALRPDLRIVAMSATLDTARFARLLDNPPLIESAGKSFPLEIIYAGKDPALRIEAQVALEVRRALAEHDGSLLAFLPGVAEIERTSDALGTLPPGIELHRLHGGIEPAAQRAALAAPPAGTRKLVLATSIAETSVTLSGVRIVVDRGLARRPRYDRGAGLTRLVTERASRAAADQRAGRAAREAPGVAIRLWEQAADAALPAHDPPEILEADLSALVLTSLLWGEADPARLPLLDRPPPASLESARRRLAGLGALDADGALTTHGREIARWPLEPRLAHMMIVAGERAMAGAAAAVAALLTERGLGGNDPDLEVRYRRWQSERGPRAEAARRMARRWAGGSASGGAAELAQCVALAFPDRLARRRDGSGETWQSAGGRGFRLDPASPLARSEWLAVAEVAGAASGARILSGAAIDFAAVEELFAERIETFRNVRFDPASGRIGATRGRRMGAIELTSAPDPKPDQDAIEAGLLDAVRRHGLGILPWCGPAAALRARAGFARTHEPAIADLGDQTLLERAEEWLTPLLAGRRDLALSPAKLAAALEGLLGYDATRAIDRLAPSHFHSPAGSSHAIDYEAPGGPAVEVRAQALFGLTEHPTVGGGRVPLTLAITSPAHRPIQTTRDLPAFWAGNWKDVAKEMRGRYPKHPWPDDPAGTGATLRTKNADRRAARGA